MTRGKWWRAVVLAAVIALLMVDTTEHAEAANPSQFDPGFIISDEQFYDTNSMTAAQIQAFLESKVSRCEVEKSYGPHDPIVCLKDYRMNTVTIPADAYCTGTYAGASNELASTIIYKVAQACGINPKVLLVTLQKEQGLVTHTWPSSYRYDKAMGFACPDTAPCDTQYFGFQNQVWRAARQFQRYKAHPSNYNYRAGMINTIYYYPPNQRPQCGASSVYIKNVATASLYNYTPYQPNQAALSNLYGTGDECSSYGNRNFWRDYSDWFGNPTTGVPLGLTVDRVSGADRYEVAVGVSKNHFPEGAPVVYVATGEKFPDAISAGPAAAQQGGPLLLVKPTSIPSQVKAELQRLQPGKIIVTGGPASVSEAVLAALEAYAPEVVRVSGADRYEVSRDVARAVFGETGSTIAYLATGEKFPDALSSTAVAASVDAPVILVRGNQTRLDQATAQLLLDLGVTDIRIAGGPASVSPGIESDLRALPGVTKVTRYGGSDRYAVSVALNRAAFTDAGTMFIASGAVFPDALSGAAAAAVTGSPLYIVPPECMPAAVADDVTKLGVSRLVIVGGPASVSQKVAEFGRCR